MSDEHDIALIVRDRSGACADQIAEELDTAHPAVLRPAGVAPFYPHH
jgi:hypothetical protein